MATQIGSDRPLEIGATLRETRQRRRIDISTVEERTKIRTKYLRALEEEDWNVLPGPAYTRGFLRTYAELLGLDAEVLVDEYRRRYAERQADSYGLAEPVLQDHLPEEIKARRGWRPVVIWVLIAQVIVALLVVIGLTAGGDDEGGKEAKRGGQQREKRASPGASPGEELPDTATVRLVARTDAQVCLVDSDGNVRIPDQLLTAGTEEGPYVAKSFALKLAAGDLSIFVNAEKQPVPTAFDPVSYKVTPAGLKDAPFRPGCP